MNRQNVEHDEADHHYNVSYSAHRPKTDNKIGCLKVNIDNAERMIIPERFQMNFEELIER